MKKLLFCAALLASGSMFAQVGIGTDTPNPAVQLQVESADKGVLIPRIALTSETQQLGTVVNADSMLIFNTATNVGKGAGYYYWNATSGKWISLFDTSKTGADGQVLTTVVNSGNTTMEWKSIGDLVSTGAVTGKTVTAETGIEFTGGVGAGTGAVLKEFGIKVKQSDLSLSEIGGKLGITQINIGTETKGKVLTIVEDTTPGTYKLEWKTVAEASQAGGGSALGSADVTATSQRIKLTGTPAGAVLKGFGIDVEESAIDIKNLGGVAADAGKVLTVVDDNGTKKMEWVDVSTLINGGTVGGGTVTLPTNAVSGKDLQVGNGLNSTGTTTGALLKEAGLSVKAGNGITVNATGVNLGGTLTAEAKIVTDAAKALVVDGPSPGATNVKINNLPAGDTTADEILVVSSDGSVKKVTVSSVASSGVVNYVSAAQPTGEKWNLVVPPAEIKKVVLQVDFGTGATFVNIGSTLSNGTTDGDLNGDDYKKVVVTNVRAIKKDSNSITQSATYDKSTGKLLMGVSGNGLVVTHKGEYYIVLEYYKGN